MKTLSGFALSALLLAASLGAQAETAAPATAPLQVTQTAQLYFLEPLNGASVERPFAIRYGLRTVTVTPGDMTPVTSSPDRQIHLLIDAPPVGSEMPVLRSDQVRLLSDQQQEKFILPSGPHSLQLIQTDKSGVPLPVPVISPVINIVVK